MEIQRHKGFTLLEILLVIAAIGILAAIVLVAINPNRQLAQARNLVRQADINTIQKALEQYLIDNGRYPNSVSTTPGYICNTGTEQTGGSINCSGRVDLRELVPDYIAGIPKDPQATGTNTGYNIVINPNDNKVGLISVFAEKKYIAINPYTFESGYVLKQLNPSFPSGWYWIKNNNMPSALLMYVDMTTEGGGYDFYPIQGNGISIGSVNSPHSGTELGLDLIYPRSKEHWIAMSNFVRNILGDNSNNYFRTTYAVYRVNAVGNGGNNNYTSRIMRDPNYYGTGAPDWRVPDGGRWWLRDTTFSEPNGDYTPYNFLGGYTFPNPYTGQDLGFNDLTPQTYQTGSFYLVSTNAKP
jgi:prepilin-type N-terminal cleavage/methylation domain-containing protein